ncbi:MAG: hypothetical protein ACRDBP_06375 [Luteolibacter sp.]
MKFLSFFLAVSTLQGVAQSTKYKNFVRQHQQGSGVIWDMQGVKATGFARSALLLESGGSLFQLWTINQTTGKDHLLDQKLVGAYLPKADVKIVTLDPYSVTRTRLDQPITVEINVSGLLSGTNIPTAAGKVLLEQHTARYSAGQTSLDPTSVVASIPHATAFISQNGKTTLNFNASSLTGTNPLKASGEEHFVVHALADGAISQSQIASAKIQVWPIATGAISGVQDGAEYRNVIPTVQLDTQDLYPRSNTYLMLYENGATAGESGKVVWSRPWDSTVPLSVQTGTDNLNSLITRDGSYTIALMSETVFDTRLLCPTVTFSVRRVITVNAMQVNFCDNEPR